MSKTLRLAFKAPRFSATNVYRFGAHAALSASHLNAHTANRTVGHPTASPGSLLRKVVIDYNHGLFVNMSRCSPDVITEIKKRQAEIKALNIESVVLMILGEWAADRAKKKR
jgi:hypothetical protein